MKPISMSTASAMPPLLPASISDCIIAPASMNWRKLCTGGKPGRSTAAPAPPVWIASSRVGKTMIGAISCGRRKVWRIERMPERPHHPQVRRQRRSSVAVPSAVGLLLGRPRRSSSPSRW